MRLATFSPAYAENGAMDDAVARESFRPARKPKT
jgi:hypothetical protein